MSKAFTTSKLITSVKRRASIPENQSTFETEDFLDFANEEIDNELIPEILRLHEDYLLKREDVSLVDSQDRYAIPTKAIGNKLRDVAFVDTNGNVYEMTRAHAGDLTEYNFPFVQTRIYAYMVEGPEIVLLPPVDGALSGSLRFFYYEQPNELVEESRTATITAIDTGTGEITVAAVPTDSNSVAIFSTSDEYDFINHKAPFNTLASELTVSSINTTTNVITFTAADLPSGLKVGDYVNLTGESSVVQLPREIHSILAHKVAMRCIEAMGDMQGLQMAEAKHQRMMDRMTNTMDSRVEDSPKKVVNRHGSLRQGIYRRRYRYRG